MIQNIIFDLDGTLLNTLVGLKDSTNFALHEFNYPPKSLDEIRSFVGNGVEKLIELAIPSGKMNENFYSCLSIFKKHYSQNMYETTQIYEGILELLNVLKEKNMKIAVVSNKYDDAVKELCKRYFGSLIDISAGEKKGLRKKPYPDGVFEVMKTLKAHSGNTFYIGDSEVDIKTAQNALLPFVAVTWGFRSREYLISNGAKIIIDEPLQLLEYLNFGVTFKR